MPKLRPPADGPAKPVATLLDFRMPDEMLAELARIQQGRGVATIADDEGASAATSSEPVRAQGLPVARIATLAEFDDELGDRLSARPVKPAGTASQAAVQVRVPDPMAKEPAGDDLSRVLSARSNRITDELAGLVPLDAVAAPFGAEAAQADSAPPFVTADEGGVGDAFAPPEDPIDLAGFQRGPKAQGGSFDTIDLPADEEDDLSDGLDEAGLDPELMDSIAPDSAPPEGEAAEVDDSQADPADDIGAQLEASHVDPPAPMADQTSVMASLSGAVARPVPMHEGPFDVSRRLDDALAAASRGPADRPTLPETAEPGATQPALALSDIARRIREEARQSQPEVEAAILGELDDAEIAADLGMVQAVAEDAFAEAHSRDTHRDGAPRAQHSAAEKGAEVDTPEVKDADDGIADEGEDDPFAEDDLFEDVEARSSAPPVSVAALIVPEVAAEAIDTAAEPVDLATKASSTIGQGPVVHASEVGTASSAVLLASEPPQPARNTRPEGFDTGAIGAGDADDELDLVGAPLDLRATPRNLGPIDENASIDDDVPELDESMDASFDDILDLPDRSESIDATGEPSFEDLVEPIQALTIPPEAIGEPLTDDSSPAPSRVPAEADALSETLGALDGGHHSAAGTPARGNEPIDAIESPRPPGPPPLPGLGARFVLRVVSVGAGEGRLIALNGDAVVIGTAAPVLVEDRFASQQHARVAVAGAKVQVEDLDSLNGVWIRLRAGHALAVGDRFLVGRQVLRVIRESAPAAPAAVDGVHRLGARSELSGFRLQVLGDDDSVLHDLRLPNEGCRIGRHVADLVFTDDDQLSATHAVVRPDANAVRLDDLGSRNGTWVRARGPQSLGVGDAFMVGRTVWRVGQPAR